MARQTETNRKLEEVERLLAAIDKTLALNTQHLADHMRRTEILEQQMEPVRRHVDQMRGAAKLLTILAVAVSLIAALRAF